MMIMIVMNDIGKTDQVHRDVTLGSGQIEKSYVITTFTSHQKMIS